MNFKLKSNYKPTGDQPKAIDSLTKGLNAGVPHQTLLGVTGSGKTFSIANVVANTNKPTLVLAHNKTLAAQLFAEFQEFFPENSVNYFISYYDYYQPEAYVAKRDLYIEKETDINKDIERYRAAATQAALSRKDILIVASVSCIYGIGSPDDFSALARTLKVGESYPRSKLLIHLTDMQYYRSEYDFYEGLYRVRGDTIDINVVGREEALRVSFFGDEIDEIKVINPISGEVVESVTEYTIFPAKEYVTPFERVKKMLPQIEADLKKEKQDFLDQGRILEATRLEQRVKYDLEMLQEVGYTNGIENYSRYLDGRKPGTPPSTLLDYLGEDWLLVVDESHITVPQVGGMYNGDRARKETLVDYGFRLKAALDNRPLKFEEFSDKLNQVIYVSATPSDYELKLSQDAVSKAKSKPEEANLPENYDGVAQQIIRPTGLLDPLVYVRPAIAANRPNLEKDLAKHNFDFQLRELQTKSPTNQIDDLLVEVRATIAKKQRVLITTLTKRMSEELTNYLEELNIKVHYIHSDIDAIERVEILRNLRLGVVDVVVGINLLREGLDLPEVSLVAILDADKEGFLRSETSFIQTIGRAARHEEGRVVMYADKVTGSMVEAITETERRRGIQEEYNRKHGIKPKSVKSKIKQQLEKTAEEDESNIKASQKERMAAYPALKPKEQKELLKELQIEMELAADAMEFERAAELRDFIDEHKKLKK